jgi:hypothetical protein
LAQTMEVLTDLEALTDTEIGAVIARSREILQERYQKRKQDEEKRAREEDERLQQLLGLRSERRDWICRGFRKIVSLGAEIV